jgi:hypothetical protein
LKLAISAIRSKECQLEVAGNTLRVCVYVHFETKGIMLANLGTKTRILAQPTSSFVSMRASNGKSSQGNSQDLFGTSLYLLPDYAQ